MTFFPLSISHSIPGSRRGFLCGSRAKAFADRAVLLLLLLLSLSWLSLIKTYYMSPSPATTHLSLWHDRFLSDCHGQFLLPRHLEGIPPELQSCSPPPPPAGCRRSPFLPSVHLFFTQKLERSSGKHTAGAEEENKISGMIAFHSL